MSETSNLVDSAVAQEAFLSEANPTQTTSTVPQTNQFVEQKGYTDEDLKRVREQEKSKLYPQIDSLKEEISLLKKDREERLAESIRIAEEKEAESRKKAEAEMDVRSLLEQKEKEWSAKLDGEVAERERAFNLLELERKYAELTAYRSQRLEEERDSIIPELVDLISGNNPEEIESSIAGLRERSSRILESAQSAMQNARKEMTGSRVTSPASGPMDTNSDQQSFTADQIAAMSVTEYAKYRGKLLGSAANQRNKGIFG
jgi:hypothetical protein